MRKTTRTWLIRLLLAAAVMAAILSRQNRTALAEALQRFDIRYALAILAVYGSALPLFAWRWKLVARALGIGGRYRDYLRGLWFSQAVGELGPPIVVGEWARFHALRGQANPGLLLVAQLVDRCSGHLVLLLIVLGLMPSYRHGLLPLETLVPVPALLGLLLVVALVAGLMLGRRLWRLPRPRAKSVASLFNPLLHPGHYWLSFILQGLLVLNWVLAAAGLGLTDNLGRVAWLAPLLLMGTGSLPGLVSDWGKREAAAILLLMPAGLAPEQALAVSLIYGAGHLAVALPGALALRLYRPGVSGGYQNR